MTNPPSIITNGALSTQEGCASVSDASGNILFYTDGSTIKNSQNVTMVHDFITLQISSRKEFFVTFGFLA